MRFIIYINELHLPLTQIFIFSFFKIARKENKNFAYPDTLSEIIKSFSAFGGDYLRLFFICIFL